MVVVVVVVVVVEVVVGEVAESCGVALVPPRRRLL